MNKQTLSILAISAALLSGVGCSKGDSTSNVSGSGIVDTSGGTVWVPGGDVSTTGSSSTAVTFNPIDYGTYNTFVATTSLNTPTNFKISVSLKDRGGYLYAGNIVMSYTDNGRTMSRTFSAGTGVVESLNNGWGMTNGKDVGSAIAKYNYWFSYAGTTVFNGFYQDGIGAIVLVIDKVSGANDGLGASTLSGHVYFKNFAYNQYPQGPARSCWFIYNSFKNYDCRSTNVINKTNVYPEGYTYLGSFSGLSKSQAFQ